ncbi:MAG: hypothetical protein J5811_00070 [Lachnospiraceae bacterium]|nr:hypothetical protein [Lachnospiraceae bacterium]MBO4807708.1 hypothetical protein [Lachnospiraceae bacterium]
MDIKLNGFTERTVKLTPENMLSSEFAAKNKERYISDEVNRFEPDKWDGGAPFDVSISEEGFKAYINFLNRSVQTKSDKTGAENEIEVKIDSADWLNPLLVFNKYLESSRTTSGYISIENKCELALKAYAESYDELVSKYDKGLNEVRFIRDESTEKGYREMTLEDELKWLEDDFALTVEHIRIGEEVFEKYKDRREEYYNEMERLVSAGKMREPDRLLEEIEHFRKRLQEKTPANLTECLMNAKTEFLNLYLNRQENGLSISDMLKQIRIFSK